MCILQEKSYLEVEKNSVQSVLMHILCRMEQNQISTQQGPIKAITRYNVQIDWPENIIALINEMVPDTGQYLVHSG